MRLNEDQSVTQNVQTVLYVPTTSLELVLLFFRLSCCQCIIPPKKDDHIELYRRGFDLIDQLQRFYANELVRKAQTFFTFLIWWLIKCLLHLELFLIEIEFMESNMEMYQVKEERYFNSRPVNKWGWRCGWDANNLQVRKNRWINFFILKGGELKAETWSGVFSYTPHPCYINKETFVPTSTLNSHSQTHVIEGSTQAAADFYDTTALITAPDGGRCETLYKRRHISQKPY